MDNNHIVIKVLNEFFIINIKFGKPLSEIYHSVCISHKNTYDLFTYTEVLEIAKSKDPKFIGVYFLVSEFLSYRIKKNFEISTVDNTNTIKPTDRFAVKFKTWSFEF